MPSDKLPIDEDEVEQRNGVTDNISNKLIIAADFDQTIIKGHSYRLTSLLHKYFIKNGLKNSFARELAINIMHRLIMNEEGDYFLEELLKSEFAKFNELNFDKDSLTTLSSKIYSFTRGIKNGDNLKQLLKEVAQNEGLDFAVTSLTEYPDLIAKVMDSLTEKLCLAGRADLKLKNIPIIYGGILNSNDLDKNYIIKESNERFHRMPEIYERGSSEPIQNIGKNHFLAFLKKFYERELMPSKFIILIEDSGTNVYFAKSLSNALEVGDYIIDCYRRSDFDGGYSVIKVSEDADFEIDYLQEISDILYKETGKTGFPNILSNKGDDRLWALANAEESSRLNQTKESYQEQSVTSKRISLFTGLTDKSENLEESSLLGEIVDIEKGI
ncbi:MAG: hypothetical protein K0Q51_777 [Rickettsiaceae bacterium]|jgi:hypothetical protein|nr:hypothetical protein [Rickettsiaceae bacterium]